MDADEWEARYAGSDRVWSGRVNPVLRDEAEGLAPGRALDAGAGEGGDAVWLAERGWEVTAVDLSPTALSRGRVAAEARGTAVAQRLRWVAGDLLEVGLPEAAFDLVSAQYLHPQPDRWPGVLARLAALTAPGGLLLVVGHHRSDLDAGLRRPPDPALLVGPDALVPHLPAGWQLLAADVRGRPAERPDGSPATAHDTVLLARAPRPGGVPVPG